MKARVLGLVSLAALTALAAACARPAEDDTDSSGNDLILSANDFWDRLTQKLATIADGAHADWKTPAINNEWAKDFHPTAAGQENVLDGEARTFDKLAEDIQGIQKTLRASNNQELHRAFHAKPHACVKGKFAVHVPDSLVTDARLPAETDLASLKTGILALSGEHDVWVRWSNGVGGKNRPDGEADVRGLALKVMNVAGDRLPDGPRFFHQEGGGTQDFLMTNGATTPAPNASSFAQFGVSQAAMATAEGLVPKAKALGNFFDYLVANPRVGATLANKVVPATLKHDSVVGQTFFSGGAIALGTDDAGKAREAIKFSAVTGRYANGTCTPESDERQALADFVVPGGETRGAANYFSTGRHGVKTFLKAGDVCIDFRIQFQRHDADMLAAQNQAIEDTSVEWRETDSPWVSVATVVIAKMADPEVDELECNDLSWNPWHGLKDHRPLGNIMRVRREVLAASAALREASSVR